MANAPIVEVREQYHRLVSSAAAHQKGRSFSDVDSSSDPDIQDRLAGIVKKTSPHLPKNPDNPGWIHEDRYVSGEGSDYVMNPFRFISSDKTGRFNNGFFGTFYAGQSFLTALSETVYHTQIFCAASSEPDGWFDFHELIGEVRARLIDIRGGGFAGLLRPDDYIASQDFACKARENEDVDGIIYPSVRHPTGTCFAVFYPDAVSVPQEGRRLRYHWNESLIDRIKDLDSGKVSSTEDWGVSRMVQTGESP